MITPASSLSAARVRPQPRVDGDVIHAVDLDLDVIRRRDGSVRVLDEDEFAEHRIRYGYPDEVVARARAATDDLVALLNAAVQPFERAALAHLPALGQGIGGADGPG